MSTNSSRKVAPLILVTSLILSLIPVFYFIGTIKASPDTIFSDNFATATNSASRYDSWWPDTGWQQLSSTTGGVKQGAGKLGLLESGTYLAPWIKTPSFATTGYSDIRISFVWNKENNTSENRTSYFKAQWSTDNTNWTDIAGTTYVCPTDGVQKIISDISVSSDDNVGNKPNLWIRWYNWQNLGSGARRKVSFDDVVITGVLSSARAVNVSISPSENSGPPETILTYTVTVKNIGTSADNYNLTKSDNANWGPTLDDNVFLNVGSGETRTTTLRVTVPVEAANGTQDLITVTATAQTDNTVKDNEICKAVCVITPPASPSENFTIIALPDTQHYPQSYPAIFDNQTNWIIQNENKENIVFVAHLGDIVETYSTTSQWQNADSAMRILDNKVLYGILPGNHDLGNDGGATYESWFPPSRYSYWDGSYVSYGPSNNLNNYQLFSVCGMNFIVIDLEYDPPAAVLSWADNVLDNYSNRRAIISTHAYLTYNGNWSQGGANIYNDLVVPHNNVFLVLCGHSYNSSTGYGVWERTDNFDGRMEYGLLSDYQDLRNPNDNKVCGNGYLRIMKFVPSENKIYVKTYSPWLDNYWTDSANQFELYYPMPAPWSVSVSITPSYKYGITGDNLTYDVTVTNTGNTTDNYTLNLDNTLSWTRGGLPATIGPIAPGNDWTGQIWVLVGGTPGTDNLTVNATSIGNPTVSSSSTCYAHFVSKGVNVSITPGTRNGLPGDNLTYTVTVQNVGASGDNYNVTVNDALGWGATVDNSVFVIPVHENRTTTLRVTISLSAVIGQTDTITVTATSQTDNTVKDNYSVTAVYPIVRSVSVSISPSDKTGWTGDNLAFGVTVTNTGNVSDNYQLSLADTLPWSAGLNAPSQVVGNNYFTTDNTFKLYQDTYARENDPDNSLTGVRYNMYVGTESGAGYSQNEYIYTQWNLAGKLPAGAVIDNAYIWMMGRYGPSHGTGNTADNMWVEAWNVENDSWNENTLTWDNKPAIGSTLLDNVHWIASIWGVQYKWYKWNATSWVQSQYAGDNIASFAFKSNGIGDDGIPYNNGWFYTKDGSNPLYDVPWLQVSYHLVGNTPNTVSLGPGENWTGTFWVVVGTGGMGTIDDKYVTATSMTDSLINCSDTSWAHSALGGVSVSITPSYENGSPGGTLNYTVTVTNTGELTDNIVLPIGLLSDTQGWTMSLDNTLFSNVPSGDNRTTTLHVTIGGTGIDNVTVMAAEQGAGQVGSDSCTAEGTAGSEFSLHLVAGWNLVCFPVDKGPSTPHNIFTGLSYFTDYTIYWWTAPGGPYSVQDPDTALLDNIAYWVYINTDWTVTYTGTQPVSGDVYFVTGWNMAGFPVVNGSTTPSNIFAPLTYFTDFVIYWWNAPGGPYSVQDPDTPLLENRGYWVYINTSKIVTVP